MSDQVPAQAQSDPPDSSDETEKRRHLLEAAAAIIANSGVAALSLRKLAADAGTSTMAVYTWFGSKPNLLRAIYREAFERFSERLRAQLVGDDPLTDLIRLGVAYRNHATADPNLYLVMFSHHESQFSPTERDLELAARTFEILVDAVGRCVDEGYLSCEREVGAWQIWAAVHGAMLLEITRRQGPDAGAEPDWAALAYFGLTRTVLIGLGADGEMIAARWQNLLPA